MADRASEVRFLREIAQRLREMAQRHAPATAVELLEMAEEFETHADEIEKRG